MVSISRAPAPIARQSTRWGSGPILSRGRYPRGTGVMVSFTMAPVRSAALAFVKPRGVPGQRRRSIAHPVATTWWQTPRPGPAPDSRPRMSGAENAPSAFASPIAPMRSRADTRFSSTSSHTILVTPVAGMSSSSVSTGREITSSDSSGCLERRSRSSMATFTSMERCAGNLPMSRRSCGRRCTTRGSRSEESSSLPGMKHPAGYLRVTEAGNSTPSMPRIRPGSPTSVRSSTATPTTAATFAWEPPSSGISLSDCGFEPRNRNQGRVTPP